MEERGWIHALDVSELIQLFCILCRFALVVVVVVCSLAVFAVMCW